MSSPRLVDDEIDGDRGADADRLKELLGARPFMPSSRSV